MAKLFKNALVDNEIIHLNHKPLTIEITSEPSTEIVNELQHETIHANAYKEGFLAGIIEAEQRMDDLKKCLERTLVSLPQAIAQNRLELNAEIADIVLLITQQFFIEKEMNHQGLELQINQILAQINNQQTVELYLHPQDISTLQQGDMTLDAAHLKGLTIKSDDALSLGGCVIKTENGIFDASIEKQIDKLKKSLLQVKKRKHHASIL